jgi:hypothetical protein
MDAFEIIEIEGKGRAVVARTDIKKKKVHTILNELR